jgi:hypothetical protein
LLNPLRLLVVLGAISLVLPFAGAGLALAQPQTDENHFRCYIVSQQTPQPAETVTLEDQFNEGTPDTVTVGEPVYICAPTAKTVSGTTFDIENEDQHYALYTAPADANPRTILVTDQFRTEAAWRVTTPKYIMVPTAKTIGGVAFDDVEDSQHYWCYEANGPRVGVRATLEDQFSGPDNVRITTPTLFCNPAEKVSDDGTFEIEDEDLHYACYEIHGKQKTQQFTIGAENQFEEDTWQTGPWEIICAPAEKTLPN